MGDPTDEPATDGPGADLVAGPVARVGPDLLRLAVLLEDEPSAAGDLVRTALAAVTGRRRRGDRDLLAAARTVLVRRALGGAASDGARGSGWVEAPSWAPDPWDGDEEVQHALGRLPSLPRAVVVLGVVAGLPAERIGRVVRLPADVVRVELAAGTAGLRAALGLDRDADLRAALAGAADRAARAVAPLTRGEVACAATARRRRRWLGAAAAAGLATVLAVTISGGVVPRPTAGTVVQEAPARVDLGGLPPRGSLAGDADFLGGLLRQPWAADSPADVPVDVTPARDTIRVLFAGDVPGGRWALLTARTRYAEDRAETVDRDDALMAWFTGPPGARPEDMRLSSFPYPRRPGVTPALVDPRTGTLVVVAAPGDVVDVSARVDVAADGSSSRTWAPARTTDGVAVAQLGAMELPWTWPVAYRVRRDGVEISSAAPDGVGTDRATRLPPLGVRYPGGRPSAEGRQAAEWATYIAVAPLGVSPADAETSARLVAPAPAPAEGAVALVTISLPSGALAVSAHWARALPDGAPGGVACGMDVRPAGAPAEDRVLAAGCALFAPADSRALDSVLVVATPPSVARVRTYGGSGDFLGEFDAEGGTVVAPMPVGTREVEGVTRAGVLLGRTPLLGPWSPSTG